MKIAKIIDALLLLSLLAYSLTVVFQARAYTATVIGSDLNTRQWRIKGQMPRPMKLRIADFTPRQREILLRVEDPDFYQHHGIGLTTPGAGLTTITQAIVKNYILQISNLAYFGQIESHRFYGFAESMPCSTVNILR